jgi:membrane associated rhomboid family serine protease
VQIATMPMANPLDPDESRMGWFTDAFVLEQSAVFHGQLWRLITYAFLHSPQTVMHILFNMLFLWWFGSDVEDLYGPREFLAIYLVSALVGGIVYVLSPLARLGSMMPCLGASGAVTAVLVLCAFHFPTRIIYLFMFLPVPIWLFVIFQVAQDTFTYLGRGATGTAVGVHLGGATFAAAYYKFHWRLTNLVPQVKAWKKRRSQPRLRVYREAEEEHATPVAVTSAPATPGRPEDEQLEAKMDAVLEKISRFGKENLNDSDREVLRLAAEAIKRRRT